MNFRKTRRLMLSTPGSTLEKILNFRDVGRIVNDGVGSNYMKAERLYRSALPDEASPSDRHRLVNEYRIKTIIDLRTSTEHIKKSQMRGANNKSSSSATEPNDEDDEPLKIPGIAYQEINFNGWAFQRFLINQLTWMQFGRLLGLMALGYRMEAIKILGENVMKPRGLVRLGTDSLDFCGQEIFQVFEVLADPASYPVMLHCTQGKDRTGLTVMLVLMLLGVPMEAIKADYMLSESELAGHMEERMAEIRSIGLTEEFAGCAEDMVDSVRGHVDERHGSVENYLERNGVTREMQDSVRSILLADC